MSTHPGVISKPLASISRRPGPALPMGVNRSIGVPRRRRQGMNDLVIRNGRIIDGTGRPGFVGALELSNGKIVSIGGRDHQSTAAPVCTLSVVRFRVK